MTLRLVAASAILAISATAAVAGPTVTPNASAITAVTPVPLNDADVTVSTQAPAQAVPVQTAPVQAAPAPQSAFIANYLAGFGR